MDYLTPEEIAPGEETCPRCKAILAELDRLSSVPLIPMPYRVREGSYVHLVASDHDYLCRYNFNRRRKRDTGRRKLMYSGPVTIILWVIAIAFVIWLLSVIF